MLGAGVAAIVGPMRLQAAQGIRLRRVKSGTLYNRAFRLARKVGVDLERVYVVPPGRGHLTNAFGLWRGIALTDNFGEYLSGPQIDFVIGHELAHVKGRHTQEVLSSSGARGGLGIVIVQRLSGGCSLPTNLHANRSSRTPACGLFSLPLFRIFV
jgi:Zn-dependent protease with chaperone function